MYNQTTHSYTMEDYAGSYSWITEGWDRADYQDWSDTDIYNFVDGLIEDHIFHEQEECDLEEQALSKRYPCYGYSTNQVFETPEEYIAFMKDEIETDLKNEREYVFGYLKSWISEND